MGVPVKNFVVIALGSLLVASAAQAGPCAAVFETWYGNGPAATDPVLVEKFKKCARSKRSGDIADHMEAMSASNRRVREGLSRTQIGDSNESQKRGETQAEKNLREEERYQEQRELCEQAPSSEYCRENPVRP